MTLHPLRQKRVAAPPPRTVTGAVTASATATATQPDEVGDSTCLLPCIARRRRALGTLPNTLLLYSNMLPRRIGLHPRATPHIMIHLCRPARDERYTQNTSIRQHGPRVHQSERSTDCEQHSSGAADNANVNMVAFLGLCLRRIRPPQQSVTLPTRKCRRFLHSSAGV